jgi:multidrug transporter EmrE-like cation transporter
MKELCVFCASLMRSTYLVDAIFLRPNHSNNKTYVYFRAVSSVASCIILLICFWFLSHFFPDLEFGVGYIVHSYVES